MEWQVLIAYGGRAWTKSDAGLALMKQRNVDPNERWPAAQYQPDPELWHQ